MSFPPTLPFRNREHAARLLAAKLSNLRGTRPLVLGIPRGAVPMARIIADELGGDLDVVLIRKLGAPGNRELAVGAVSETGDIVVAPHAASVGADRAYIDEAARVEFGVIRERRRRLAPVAEAADPAGRVVIVVDDGIATGTTMLAALAVLRQRKPKRLVVAAGVAPPRTVERLRAVADEVVCLETPEDFAAVGQFYDDFDAVTDDQVLATLQDFQRARTASEEAITGEVAAAAPTARPASTEDVGIPAGAVTIAGTLALPAGARGLVLFAHGSGSSRFSKRNGFVAERLRKDGLGTLLMDLLTEEEDAVYETRFDIDLLTDRLEAAARWAAERPESAGLPIGFFGASTGAACAIRAAARLGDRVAAVVSRGGRPDLARQALPVVRAPTLLIVGGADYGVIELNESAFAQMRCEKRLDIVPGATHLFEERGALEAVAGLAADWFVHHMAPAAAATPPVPTGPARHASARSHGGRT